MLEIINKIMNFPSIFLVTLILESYYYYYSKGQHICNVHFIRQRVVELNIAVERTPLGHYHLCKIYNYDVSPITSAPGGRPYHLLYLMVVS